MVVFYIFINVGAFIKVIFNIYQNGEEKLLKGAER